MKKFSDRTIEKFEALKRAGKIPSFATNLNPLDLTGSATTEMFVEGTKVLLEDPEVHGILFFGLHHAPALQEDFVDRIANLAKGFSKPIVACDIGETEMALYIRFRFDKQGIPSYFSPEDAARAMIALVDYGQYLKKTGSFEKYVERFKTRKK